MKYKFSALILGLTFAGVSHAGTLTFTYTLGTNIFGGALQAGDTISAPSFATPVTLTLDTTAGPTLQTLYTVNFTPAGTTNGSNTLTATDTLTITNPASGVVPAAVQFITAAFLDSVAGAGAGRTHTLSDTLASTQVATYIFTTTGYKLTVTPVAFATIAPTTTGTASLVTVAANFQLTAPEPGTWFFLSSSLIGLALYARRRKSVNQV